MGPISIAYYYKLAEVVDSIVLDYPAAYNATFCIAMNKEKWGSLPEDVKKTIKEVNSEWIPKHGKDWDEMDKKGMTYLKAKKRKVIDLDVEESLKWSNAVQPLFQQYVDKMNKRQLPGDELLLNARKAVAEAWQ